MLSYSIFTIGCQQNEFEAARIDFMLESAGLQKADLKDADVVFVVACAVRQTAVDRIFGKLRIWKDKKVVITSCVLSKDKKQFEEKGASYWDYNKPEELSALLGLKSKSDIASLMEQGRRMSLYVPIMTGCNNFCSYCAVPYTKGREVSRPISSVVSDVGKIISDKNFKSHSEIMLLGQNVNSYKITDAIADSHIRESDNKKSDFTILLEKLNQIPGDFVISFTSNHPKDLSIDIIKAVSELEKVKKEIHLPVQSGSDRILRLMNRPYTAKKYLSIVEEIRKIDPEIDITTDVIVGFPGETEADFNKTVQIFKKAKYAKAYVNKYSPREGTAAYKLADPISWAEKQRRWRILDDMANKN